MNPTQAISFAIDLLANNLPEEYVYHSVGHTKDVIRACEEISEVEPIETEQLNIIKTAAAFHDTGFLEDYHKNEPIGARIAREHLPNFGYTDQQIDEIERLILSTTVGMQPQSASEMILNDADYDYFGRADYFEIAAKLRVELDSQDVSFSEEVWINKQIDFVAAHKYYTSFGLQSRRPGKLENVTKLRIQLRKLTNP